MSAVVNRRSTTTLYAEADDPIGHIVRIVLAEKDLHADTHYVTSENKPEALNELNPYHGVLTLIDRDLVLYDAQIMIEYLDERYPHPPLMPVDPASRANNRQIRFRIMRDLFGLVPALRDSNVDTRHSARATACEALHTIAPAFARNRYFLADEFSLTDCCLAPFLWRVGQYGLKLSIQAKPLLKYAEMLFARSAFRLSLSTCERGMH
jgi:stringent starvation protein A